MGSELVDTATGRLLWGLRESKWYIRAWCQGEGLAPLHLTPDELNGRYGRVHPGKLLKFPAFMPFLHGVEPYRNLTAEVNRVSVHPDAVLEFPYDWRLPVAYNAVCLRRAAQIHLEQWRQHPEQLKARRAWGGEEARLVIIAHSMGGLLARHMVAMEDAPLDIRATVTLGTPFFGSVKAALLLHNGLGAPFPLKHSRVHALAVTLPGVYDLLPNYRCVDEQTDARTLTPADIATIGGSEELADRAMTARSFVRNVALPGHVQVFGAQQHTPQSLTLNGGKAAVHRYTCKRSSVGAIDRVDLAGDGTVSSEAARLPGLAAMPIAQSHGALSKTREALVVVRHVLTGQDTGPWEGAGLLGMDVPDVVEAGQPFEILFDGVERPTHVSCAVTNLDGNRPIHIPVANLIDGRCRIRTVFADPGIYRISAATGGASPVVQLVLVADREADQAR